MKISNEFTVHTPIERAWAVLTDLPGIAPCMPGARLTGVDGDVYQGKVKVKVGPVISEFAGTARFTEKDASAYRAAIDAKGRDARSAGNASAMVTAVLKAAGDSTLVSVDTDLKISGKLAQFGSGMIKEVSGKLLAQFVTNLEAKLAAEDDGVTSPAGSANRVAAPSDSVPATSESAASAAVSAPAASAAVAAPAASAAVSAPAASAAAAGTVPDMAVAPADLAPTPVPSVDEAALAESPVSTQEPKPGGEANLAGTDPPAAIRTVPSVPPASSASPSTESSSRSSESSSRSSESSTVTATGIAEVGRRDFRADEEPEALDLLAVAGGSIYKRLVPVAIGVVAVGAVIAWLVSRR
jgi:carbon monoxide dehydrogenase subunit G